MSKHSRKRIANVLRGGGSGHAPAAIDVRPDAGEIVTGSPLTREGFAAAFENMKHGGRMTYVQHRIPHSSLVVGEVVITQDEENES